MIRLGILLVVAGFLQLVPIEWLAFGFSIVALAGTGVALRLAVTAITATTKLAEQQSGVVEGMAAKAEEIDQHLSDG